MFARAASPTCTLPTYGTLTIIMRFNPWTVPVIIVGSSTFLVGLFIGSFVQTGERVLPPANSTGMHDAMSGMMTGLEGKTGDSLDDAFLEGMIVHHEGAVAMARTLLAGTKRPELIELGNSIITAQTAEIEMMKRWREDWFAI